MLHFPWGTDRVRIVILSLAVRWLHGHAGVLHNLSSVKWALSQ